MLEDKGDHLIYRGLPKPAKEFFMYLDHKCVSETKRFEIKGFPTGSKEFNCPNCKRVVMARVIEK